MSSGKLFLGVLAGVAAGATMGILFAPEKGSKTRSQIVDKKNKYVDDVKGKFDKLYNDLSHKFEQAKGETDDLVASTKKKYSDTKREVENQFS